MEERKQMMAMMEEARAQRAAMEERKQMMAMMEAQKAGLAQQQGHKRSNSADGNAPRNWREHMSEEDAMRVQILAEQIGKILDSAHSWQYAIRTVTQQIPNLKLEIAKELYPLIQNQTIVERRDLTDRTLHIVDVLHAKVAPPEAKGQRQGDDPLNAKSIDHLVEQSRRFSTSQSNDTSRQIAQLQARARQMEQQDQGDSSDEEYDFADQPPTQQEKQQTSQPAYRDMERKMTLEHNEQSDAVLAQFAMAQSMAQMYGDQDNEPSAFEEEERTEQVKQGGLNAVRPIIRHKRRPSSSQRNGGRQLEEAQTPVAVPDTAHDFEPPEDIDRRKSERLVAQIPKQARASTELSMSVQV